MKKLNYLTIIGIVLGFFFATAILTGCDDNETNIAPDQEENEKVAEFDGTSLNIPFADGMTRADDPEPVTLPDLEPIGAPQDESAVIDAIFNNIKGIIINRTKVYNTGFSFDEMSVFSPIENLIYPGSVFVGSSIPNGKFLPLPNHTVGNITWSARGLVSEGMDVYAYDVVNPRSSDFNTVTGQWFSSRTKPLGSSTTYELNEVSTQREIGAKLGVGFDTDDIRANLNLSGKHERAKTHVLVKAVQKSFSVAMDLPQGGILKTANIDDMDGVMPVYVSEVFYGRMGYAIISSEHEYHEVVAALNLNIPTDNIDINIETSYKEILDAAASSQYIIGGKSEDHGKAMKKGWEGFKEALSAGLAPADARPIAYTLRYVHDNSVARVVLSGNFTLNESYFIPETDELTISFTPVTVRAKAGNRKPICLFGSASVKLARDNQWQDIFKRTAGEYIHIEDGETETPLRRDQGFTKSIKIRRPSGMSMRDFLNEKVNIKAVFQNADVAGTRAIDYLGDDEYTVTVRDLLFSSLNGRANIFVRRNYLRDYEANLVFDISIKNDNVKVLNNRYGE